MSEIVFRDSVVSCWKLISYICFMQLFRTSKVSKNKSDIEHGAYHVINSLSIAKYHRMMRCLLGSSFQIPVIDDPCKQIVLKTAFSVCFVCLFVLFFLEHSEMESVKAIQDRAYLTNNPHRIFYTFFPDLHMRGSNQGL